MTGLRVRALARGDLVDFLPLFAGYQRFYRARSDRTRNLRFFGRFIAPSEEGVVLGAWREERPVGFACVYWTYSSVRATRVALLNDLYVAEDARGQGVGRKLLSSAKTAAARRGIRVLRWFTAPTNKTARRMYDRTGASSSHWVEYTLE